ncbi:hypothetical protein KA025_03510 [Candidatus Saccharibacteria bacterium]|nr:hypothetical protein [Candidatus Saccharibacteria bacterium]
MFGQNDNNQAVSAPQPNSVFSQATNDLNNQIPPAPPVSDPVPGALGSDNASAVNTPPVVEPVQANPTPPATSAGGDLLDIKQKALQELSPLVKHLDQTPSDKFKTTMMMIQASDDQALIPAAYEAANKIINEKEKAQALLDIVNEINYFTNKDAA